jgi:GntR family transcriptional regulator
MPDPMWRRIAEDLRQKIESGELGGDSRPLPSELELREMYDASRNTVRDAVKWLVTRGLVVTRPGQGTFVVQEIDPFVTKLTADISAGPDTESAGYASDFEESTRIPGQAGSGQLERRAESSDPRVEIQPATGMVAVELRIPDGTQLISRHQQRSIDGTPWSLQTTFYPMVLVEDGATMLLQAKDINGGAVKYIEETIGTEQVGWVTKITVRAPNRTETDFFGLPDDGRISVFENIRTGFDRSGKPFRVTITTYPADRNQFVMTAGQLPDD